MTISTLEYSPTSIVRPREGVLAREVGGEMVILNVELGTYYGLNEVGTRAWALLVGGAVLGDVRDRLLAEFEIDRETVTADLDRLLHELVRHGLIDVSANLSVV